MQRPKSLDFGLLTYVLKILIFNSAPQGKHMALRDVVLFWQKWPKYHFLIGFGNGFTAIVSDQKWSKIE